MNELTADLLDAAEGDLADCRALVEKTTRERAVACEWAAELAEKLTDCRTRLERAAGVIAAARVENEEACYGQVSEATRSSLNNALLDYDAAAPAREDER